VTASVPADVEALARSRAEARSRREWHTADALRAQIEAAGWKVIDDGVRFRLEPAHPPDVIEGDHVRYGSSASVPSRLADAPTGLATVILVATEWPADLERACAALRAYAPAGTSTVIVADDPSPEQAAALEAGDLDAPVAGMAPEVVWTSARLGHAAALNAGFRRATAPVVIVLDTSVEPVGDIITPMVTALEDPSVGVAGAFGVDSSDLRHFEPAPAGEVDAVEGYCLAFRRDDVTRRGPLDERFRFYRDLDLWWSLALRDEGPDVPPRRAVAVEVPLVKHEHRAWAELDEPERTRLSKRNFYRIIDRFGHRLDLLKAPAGSREPTAAE